MGPVRNALTIDVEDYFQVSAFEKVVPVTDWERYPLRVEQNTRVVLELLARRGVQGTFFVLGWVAERCPDLVREIQRCGHEIASHGYGHRRVTTQSRAVFRDDIRRSKAILEEITGERVHGYRAPSYSISLDTLWAYDELAEAGYTYDSSVFPIRHDLYGIPHWPRFPFTVCRSQEGVWEPDQGGGGDRATMREFPITTLNLLGRRLPIAGGGYFRLFPYCFTRWGLERINRLERRPFIFYLHPWEFDPEQPRIAAAPPKSRLRHYLNLASTRGRFARLLEDFSFTTMRRFMEETSSGVASRTVGAPPVETRTVA